MMHPSSFQTTIENQFDYICKRAIENERKNYVKHLSGISNREVSFTEIGDYRVNQFSVMDQYVTDLHMFTVRNYQIGLTDSGLSEALQHLDTKKRDIILLYYFMEMNDTEISTLFNLNRSTIHRHHISGLESIKHFMKECSE